MHDLQPAEATFQLSDKPGKTYTIRKISLAVQIWVNNRFGREEIKGILENKRLPEISEIIHYLIKDKTDFPTLLDLQESICTQADREALLKALFTSIGLSQPVIDKLNKEYDEGNAQSLNPPIGANIMTSSPTSMDTPSNSS